MDLDEFCWRKRITLKEISAKTGICPNTLSHIKNLKMCPNLDTAIRLHYYTLGLVTYMEMLPEKSKEKLKNCMCLKETKEMYIPIM